MPNWSEFNDGKLVWWPTFGWFCIGFVVSGLLLCELGSWEGQWAFVWGVDDWVLEKLKVLFQNSCWMKMCLFRNEHTLSYICIFHFCRNWRCCCCLAKSNAFKKETSAIDIVSVYTLHYLFTIFDYGFHPLSSPSALLLLHHVALRMSFQGPALTHFLTYIYEGRKKILTTAPFLVITPIWFWNKKPHQITPDWLQHSLKHTPYITFCAGHL